MLKPGGTVHYQAVPAAGFSDLHLCSTWVLDPSVWIFLVSAAKVWHGTAAAQPVGTGDLLELRMLRCSRTGC